MSVIIFILHLGLKNVRDLSTLIPSKVNIRDSVKVLGMFEAASPSVRWEISFFLLLQKLRNSSLKQCLGDHNGYWNLDEESNKKLILWSNNLSSSNKIFIPHTKDVIFLDDCPNDWGAAYKNHSAGGHWSKEESLLQIDGVINESCFVCHYNLWEKFV